MIEFKILKPYEQISAGAVGDVADLPSSITANQVHGTKVAVLSERPNTPPTADALMTNHPGLQLTMRVADCQGIVIYDPITQSIAAVHSGWRGSAQNIIGKTIGRLQSEFGSRPSDLMVAISPSLGPCCAEFTDPATELPAFAKPFIKGKWVDFWKLSEYQLIDAGVSEENIELPSQCTKCSGQFYSHRNQDSGRMGVFIRLELST